MIGRLATLAAALILWPWQAGYELARRGGVTRLRYDGRPW